MESIGYFSDTHCISTGGGDYYCSGNDLNNFTKIPEGGIEKMAKDAGELLR